MRLLRLRLAGFGAYAAPLDLDFCRLPEDALFLIHGPTGGGKTTLLDAVCYALFGDTSTGERDVAHLRSHHAGAGADTFVALDFAVRGEVYRVRRAPEYQRKAQRGGRLVRQPARAELFRLADGAPDAAETAQLAARAKEVSGRVHALLGVDVQQFRQIALLPQGRFRELLVADSKERERIMAGLFGTEELARFQLFLKDRARALAAEIKDLRARREAVLGQLGAADEAALAAEEASLSERLAGLAAAVELAREVEAGARVRLEAARAANATLEGLARAQEALAALEARLPEQVQRRARLEQAERAQALAAPLRELQRARDDYAAARRRREDAEGALGAAAEAVEKAKAAYRRWLGAGCGLERRLLVEADRRRAAAEEAHNELLAIERAWRLGRAAQLAAGLAAGQPCPVCGSPHHPAPAVAGDGTVPEDEQVDARRHKAEAMRREAERAACDVEAFRAVLRTLPAEEAVPEITASPGLTPDRFAAELKAAQEARRRAEEALLGLREQQAALLRQEGELRARGEAVRAEVDAAVAAAGFAGLKEVAAAGLDVAAITALRGEIEAFDRRLIEAQTRRADAKAAAAGVAAQELRPLEAALAGRVEAREAAVRAEQSCRDRMLALRDAAGRLEELARKLAALEARYGVLGRLADIANGEGGAARVTFQRFVLAALLDEALDAASQRLKAMSRGRYLLRRVREAADRRVSAGLDLEIDDAYTGRARPVSTLSGGESFMAALALALGMADVVSRHAGGVRLDVMFIDEGFGALDAEALDLALRTLIDLRRQGRMIGIISHVPELKERIDYRLEVRATSSGSSARFVLP